MSYSSFPLGAQNLCKHNHNYENYAVYTVKFRWFKQCREAWFENFTVCILI